MDESARKLGAAVWGAGGVSAEHIRSYGRNLHAEVVAVGSRTLDGAQRRIAAAGLPLDRCLAYDDLDRLLADHRIDVVSVCTPNYLHAEHACRIARAGKHVVIEKPPAITLDGLIAMRDAIRQAGVRSIVSFVLRWHPLLLAVKELCDSGEIGDVVLARADYWHRTRPEEWSGYRWARTKQGGGSIMLAGGCHAVDALRFLVGSEVVSVGARHGPVRPASGYEWPGTTMAVLEFASGAVAEASACTDAAMPYVFNLEVLGEKGSTRGNRVASARYCGEHAWHVLPVESPDTGDVAYHPFQEEIDHFVECILAGREASPNIEDAVRTTEICLAADLAADERRTVSLPLPGLED